jgi:hypothetical protein
MVLFASVSFAGDLDGVRGSKWGSTPDNVLNYENVLGGVFVKELINDSGFYELQFDFASNRGPAISFYEFHGNKLISGGLVIMMDESDWSIYYNYYKEVKTYLEQSLKTKPKFNSCDEIQVLDETNHSCKVRTDWMGEQIAFKKVELYNIFKTNITQVEIKLHGGDYLNAGFAMYFKAI